MDKKGQECYPSAFMMGLKALFSPFLRLLSALALLAMRAHAGPDTIAIEALEADANITTQVILEIKGDDPQMADVQRLLVYEKKDSGDLIAIRYDVPARGHADKNGRLFLLKTLESADGAVLNTTDFKVTFRLNAGRLSNPREASAGPLGYGIPHVDTPTAHIHPETGGPLILSYLYHATLNPFDYDQYKQIQLGIFRDEQNHWQLSTDTGPSPSPDHYFSHMYCWKGAMGIASSVPITAWTSWDTYTSTNSAAGRSR